jgi:glycosyltransferase involved in cell wall biosynthesis
LVSHKGLDLVKGILDELLCEDVQFIVLGKGDVEYENYFKYMESRYNGKCRALIAFNRDMASKIYSGADIFLMPSKQEPCGLSQMIACKYGTVPVVRKTGGLADSITPFSETRKPGNGFRFENYNAHEMLYVIKDAIFTYGDKTVWNALVQSAVNSDFSWEKSSKEIKCLVLGTNPNPIARTLFGDDIVKIYRAKIANIELTEEDKKLDNGTILPRSSPKLGVFVKTVDGAIELLEMQMPGGKILPAKVLMNGRKINPYDAFKQVIQIF